MSTTRRALPQAETEAELQANLFELAGILRVRLLHVRRSIGKGKRWQTTTSIVGWPDIFAYSPKGNWHFAAELKSENGVVTPEQMQVLIDLEDAGVPTFIWRPKDWDQIQRVMQHGPTAA